MDGGPDYGGDNGSGPYASPATIKEVANGSWPGTPGLYPRYEVTAGKAKGLHMYISEDCSPLVKTGDTVTADTPICQYEDHGTHLEIGWAKKIAIVEQLHLMLAGAITNPKIKQVIMAT